MQDATRTTTGLEAIGVVLALVTFITAAIATFVVAKETPAEAAIAQVDTGSSGASRLSGVFN
jgi:hypothetical protein